MDAVKGSGEDEEVITAELCEAGVEFAVVYQAAGLVDNKKGKHDPARVTLVQESAYVKFNATYITELLQILHGA